MSQLTTHSALSVDNIIAIEPGLRGLLRPGELVRYHNQLGTFGIVVANVGSQLTVVWSRSPDASLEVIYDGLINGTDSWDCEEDNRIIRLMQEEER